MLVLICIHGWLLVDTYLCVSVYVKSPALGAGSIADVLFASFCGWYVSLCVYHTHIHTHTSRIYMHMYTHTHTYMCVCVVCVYVCMCVCVCVYMHNFKRLLLFICVYFVCVCTRILCRCAHALCVCVCVQTFLYFVYEHTYCTLVCTRVNALAKELESPCFQGIRQLWSLTS